MSLESDAKGVALVTGSGSGIGRGIALRLASDGYDLALNDLAASEQTLDAIKDQIRVEHPGRRVCIVLADVSVEEQVKHMINSAVEILGRLDVMIANAGIIKSGLIAETSVEDLDAVLAVNVRGPFLCYKYAAQKMIEQGIKGRIVGASSLAGKKGHVFLSAYCASKFAVRALTQTAAIEYGKYGITVNAYAPGLIDTPMLQVLQGDIVKYTGDEGGITEPYKKMTAVGYLGKPNDVAGLVSYLVSPESHYLTGQTLSIDGGIYYD